MNPWHYIWYGIGWSILISCALTLVVLVVVGVCNIVAEVVDTFRVARARRRAAAMGWRSKRAGGGGSDAGKETP